MSEVTKIKNGFLIDCDCGAVHKITKNSEGEIVIKSKFEKKDKEKTNENKGIEEQSKTGNDQLAAKSDIDTFFD